MRDEIIVVVAGGDPLRPDVAALVPPQARVLAADGGIAHALALGLRAETVIGDLDSATPQDLAEAEADGARIERHPTTKDATDLELALDAALVSRPRRVLVLADDGGRLDHLLSALLLFGSARYADVELDAQVGRALVHVIRTERALQGAPGEIVSLLALHGRAEGVSTQGLAYPLAQETLEPGSSRGVSNVFVGSEASVRLEHGVLLALRPGAEAEEQEEAK